MNHNEVTGLVSGTVVQAGHVAGDIHIHPGRDTTPPDRALWDDFARKGKPFYPTFVRFMANDGHLEIDFAELVSQVLELTKLGSDGEEQDRGLITGLAHPLREKADALIDAASRYVLLLAEFVKDRSRPMTDCNAAGTEVVNAYFDLVIAGLDGGHTPAWFSLDDLPSSSGATMSREAADRVLYRQVDEYGKKFYPTYARAMRSAGKVNIEAVTMARRLVDLAGIGGSGAADDVIGSATPSLSSLVLALRRDALALSQAFVDVAAGRPVVRQDLDFTPVAAAFTRLLAACAKAGHRPKWFKPRDLRG
ncbi:hypothetical protein H4696_009868 [Amycolatopsis lexingtonensis]|uniref:Uncharacterized protein n=1 Tax=Amycolatopsis lexingtonensis TaxID=218822 RepID=A0ABR9IHV5_9PSEU|nr:hypothetical protein [Amycolatopsis lexingtonensis]MBE1502768.1 hypothetical protein [Amycolatopsis lexingtonensis]